MRGLEFFGICFISGILSLMLVALICGAIMRVNGRSRKAFVARMRKEFQERHPDFKAECYNPIITERSGCCQVMLWEVLYSPPRYYCDKCGKENVKNENGFVAKKA